MRFLIFTILGFILVFPVAGASAAVVFMPVNPAPEEQKAAEELAHYWEKMTGEQVKVMAESPALARRNLRYHRFGAWRQRFAGSNGEEVVFFVGETEAGRRQAPLPPDLDSHGFVMRSAENRLFLRGGSPLGTEFAVYRFLQLYGGIRWYFPTERGEHVPDWRENRLPVIDLVEEPDFSSRQWSNATRFTENDWDRRNLMGSRDRFHHSLHRIFTEAVYEERSDFFIMLGGQRIRPDDTLRGLNHQICFGNRDAAVFAAGKAAEYFDANPGQTSFALGMTDTHHICGCADCQSLVDPAKRFRGQPDYSDLVFTFMNRAAEELAKTHPDKYLGTLAYHWAENTPSFPVHPNVIPYLTADRSMWHSDRFREQDKDLMTRWSEAGPERLGIYDYYYGNSFVIPRVFTAVTAESLRHANEAGIDGFYAEIYSNWTLDGPKAWLTSQLLWDADQDRGKLLGRYYEDLFGEASQPMTRFFERCEEIWMGQGEPVFWLKFYFDFTQLELFPPQVCVELRVLLSEAEFLAGDDLSRERVRLVSEAFRLTELYSDLYHLLKDSAARVAGLDWEELVATMETAVSLRKELETHYAEVLLPNELHRSLHRMETKARFVPGVKLAQLVERSAVLSRGEDPRERLEKAVDAVQAAFPESRPEWALARQEGGSPSRLINGSFDQDADWTGLQKELLEDPGYTPFFWQRQTQEAAPAGSYLAESSSEQEEDESTPAGFVLVDDEAFDGEFSLRVQKTVMESLTQQFFVTSGQIYHFSAWAKGRVSPGSRIEIELSWRDADGRSLAEEFLSLDRLLPGENVDWQKLFVATRAPATAVRGYARLTVRDQGPDDFVYFDHVTLVAQGETR